MERAEKKVIIDPYRGGEDIGSSIHGIIEKNYNLDLSKYIANRLKELNIPVSLTRDKDDTLSIDDRVKKIQSTYGKGNDIIVISNALTTGGENAEIIYALRNSNALAKLIQENLETAGLTVGKYYQRRLPSDTAKDYNQLIRDTANNESIIIYYGNIDNEKEATYLKNNLENIGEAIVIALANYLKVPYTPINDKDYYIVKKGDSLYSIANKYNTSVNDLKTLNNLSTNNLSIGQVLKLPNNNQTTDTTKNISYTVKKGDSLYSIAKKYNTTVSIIKSNNNLKSETLQIGQILKIPANETEETNQITYQVKKGDSLYSIAKKYNTTAEEIKKLNNLSSNLLQIGQILKINSNSSNNTINYKVVSGDSLYSIAKKYNTTVDKIKNLNNLNTNLLQIGQTLKIPTNS